MSWVRISALVASCFAFDTVDTGDFSSATSECPQERPRGGISLIQTERNNRVGQTFIADLVSGLFGQTEDAPSAPEDSSNGSANAETSSNVSNVSNVSVTPNAESEPEGGNVSASTTANSTEAHLCPKNFPHCDHVGDCIIDSCINGCNWTAALALDPTADPAEGYNHLHGIGDGTKCTANYKALDICGNSCSETVVGMGAPCDMTWEAGCGDATPPAGFLPNATLAQLCPAECQAVSNAANATQNSSEASNVTNTTASDSANASAVDAANETATLAPIYAHCVDSPANWTSSSGLDCARYVIDHFCTPDGGYGSAWNNELQGNFSEWKVNGTSALEARCGCGGGIREADPNASNVTDLNASNVTDLNASNVTDVNASNATDANVSNLTVDLSNLTDTAADGRQKDLEEIFERLDQDGDGQITPEELHTGLSR